MTDQDARSSAQLRKDPILGRWVLFAEHRAGRPNEFAGPCLRPLRGTGASASATNESEVATATCPFCPGSESATPASVYEIRDTQGHWQIRVVPNKYPAVEQFGEWSGSIGDPSSDEAESTAWGAHEVVIESRRHIRWLGDLTVDELANVLATYQQRMQFWKQDGRCQYGVVWKNVGPAGGASLAHIHSQFVALSEVPPAVGAELARAECHFREHGTCPCCELVTSERRAGRRIVEDADEFVAFCPRVSIQPFETWIMPANHEPSFETLHDDGALQRLAKLLSDIFNRLEKEVAPTGYNMLLRTAPWREGVDAWCHWRIEILPRSSAVAGFELATGVFINHVLPENAARRLRSQ